MLEDGDYLAHYGVLGMKWGVRNAETKKRYSRDKKKRKRKSVDKGKAEYQKLREQTLKSTDPEVLVKGLHTLSDSELDAKIRRVKKEKEIRDLAADSAGKRYDALKKKEEYRTAKKNRRAAGLSGEFAKTAYNSTVSYAGRKIVDELIGKNKNGNNKNGYNKKPMTSPVGFR